MAIGATAVWRARPGGSNLNGGGYDAGIAGAATDYSQQDAAQATGTAGTAAGTTAFSDAGGSFTSAMIGNALWIASGAGFTVGAYFITGFTSSAAVTLDRSPGTGSAAVWKLGGGWRDFWTNGTATAAALKAGNTVFILGGASPSYGSPDYSATAFFAFPPDITGSGGLIKFLGDPATPGTNGFKGYPLVTCDGLFLFNGSGSSLFKNVWFTATGTRNSGHNFIEPLNGECYIVDCVYDQNGYDFGFFAAQGNSCGRFFGLEAFSSVAARAGNTSTLIFTGHFGGDINNCNLHNCVGATVIDVLSNVTTFFVKNTIIAKNNGRGIFLDDTGGLGNLNCIMNCTIDANLGNGVEFNGPLDLLGTMMINNIISNHATGGKFGVVVDSGTAASNELCKGTIDYNMYYNNNADLSNISYGPNDVHGGSNPYVGQSTQNYTLTGAPAFVYPVLPFPQHTSGQTTTVRSWSYPGAVRQTPSKGTAYLNGPFPQSLAGQTTTVRSFLSPGAVQVVAVTQTPRNRGMIFGEAEHVPLSVGAVAYAALALKRNIAMTRRRALSFFGWGGDG